MSRAFTVRHGGGTSALGKLYRDTSFRATCDAHVVENNDHRIGDSGVKVNGVTIRETEISGKNLSSAGIFNERHARGVFPTLENRGIELGGLKRRC